MDLFFKLLTALGWDRLSPASRARKSPFEGAGSRRAAVRKRQRLRDAFLASDGMIKPRACTLIEMSPLGCSVEIWDQGVKSSLVADEVTLYLPDERKEVLCSVRSRRNNAVGLKFISPFRAPTRSYR